MGSDPSTLRCPGLSRGSTLTRKCRRWSASTSAVASACSSSTPPRLPSKTRTRTLPCEPRRRSGQGWQHPCTTLRRRASRAYSAEERHAHNPRLRLVLGPTEPALQEHEATDGAGRDHAGGGAAHEGQPVDGIAQLRRVQLAQEAPLPLASPGTVGGRRRPRHGRARGRCSRGAHHGRQGLHHGLQPLGRELLHVELRLLPRAQEVAAQAEAGPPGTQRQLVDLPPLDRVEAPACRGAVHGKLPPPPLGAVQVKVHGTRPTPAAVRLDLPPPVAPQVLQAQKQSRCAPQSQASQQRLTLTRHVREAPSSHQQLTCSAGSGPPPAPGAASAPSLPAPAGAASAAWPRSAAAEVAP